MDLPGSTIRTGSARATWVEKLTGIHFNRELGKEASHELGCRILNVAP